MKIILLMVLFSTPEHPAVHGGAKYGYGPRQAPNMEICQQREKLLLKQLELTTPSDISYATKCVEMVIAGGVRL